MQISLKMCKFQYMYQTTQIIKLSKFNPLNPTNNISLISYKQLINPNLTIFSIYVVLLTTHTYQIEQTKSTKLLIISHSSSINYTKMKNNRINRNNRIQSNYLILINYRKLWRNTDAGDIKCNSPVRLNVDGFEQQLN